MEARHQFREELDSLRIEIDALAALAEAAVQGAAAALIGGDERRAKTVIAGDDRLDELFVALEEQAYAVIAQQAPVAADLRFLMSALRVMSDYEKIGDRAVSVAKLSLAGWRRETTAVALLGRMADLSLGLLADARRAWLAQDLSLAVALKRRDATLDECYRRLTLHLLGLQGADVSGVVLHGHAAGRNLERIADHAVIIGERVSYMMTGDPSALAAEIA